MRLGHRSGREVSVGDSGTHRHQAVPTNHTASHALPLTAFCHVNMVRSTAHTAMFMLPRPIHQMMGSPAMKKQRRQIWVGGGQEEEQGLRILCCCWIGHSQRQLTRHAVLNAQLGSICRWCPTAAHLELAQRVGGRQRDVPGGRVRWAARRLVQQHCHAQPLLLVASCQSHDGGRSWRTVHSTASSPSHPHSQDAGKQEGGGHRQRGGNQPAQRRQGAQVW